MFKHYIYSLPKTIIYLIEKLTSSRDSYLGNIDKVEKKQTFKIPGPAPAGGSRKKLSKNKKHKRYKISIL